MLPDAYVRYPFAPAAAQFVEAEGVELSEVPKSSAYASARALARQRLLNAIDDSTKPALPVATLPANAATVPKSEVIVHLLSYVYARILLSVIEDPWLVRRHALAESVRAKECLVTEGEPEAVAEAGQALGFGMRAEGRDVIMHFTEYLRNAVHLKDANWKLVSQPMKHGWITLDREKAARLVQEELRRRIERELPRPVSDELAKAVAKDIKPIEEALTAKKATMPIVGFGRVNLELIPPCMTALLGQLQRGENVAHNGRFATVTFLHRIGMSSEEIMSAFAQAPDFREDLTRYQVEHITGVSSGIAYSVPSCENLKTFNLCAANDLCRSTTRAGRGRVRFPQDYYRLEHESWQEVEKIAKVLPIANATALIEAAARNFFLLKRLREIASNPEFQRIDGQTLIGLALARRYPIEVRSSEAGKAIVLPEADPWAVIDLLNQPFVDLAFKPKEEAAPPNSGG